MFLLLASLPLLMAGSEFKERRHAKYQSGQSTKILDSSKDAVERRGAFRALLDDPRTAPNAAKYLSDRDAQIRLAAYNFLCTGGSDRVLDYLKQALKDPSPTVRLFALERISGYVSNPDIGKSIEEMGAKDPDYAVRQYAGKLTWPFNRENKLLKDDPSWDYEILTVKTFPLSDTAWRFMTDPKGDGHRRGFFENDFKDNGWKPIHIGNWETQGWADYDGIAWYRIRFNMPSKIDSNAVELNFEGVDESAWVWLNGVYIGKHDIGEVGWDEPFRLDMTKEVKWGAENILTVRVLDRARSGGIWKPVHVDILK